MSVMDSRTKCILGMGKTESGMKIVCSDFNNVDIIQLNRLHSMSLQEQIQYAVQNDIHIKILNYKGQLPTTFRKIPEYKSELNTYKIPIQNIKDYTDILSVLKTFFVNANINLLYIGNGITYDNPFLALNGQIVCYFTPKFEKNMSMEYISIQDEYFIYNYTKNVFLLLPDAQRHIVSVFTDKLIVNLKTGSITCEYKDVIDGKYCEYMFIFNKNAFEWEKSFLRTTRVDGYKPIKERKA